uniref:Uncharacterized protein n=1 Tax=Spongospora subterranea TaxID=70186 RepID=A0A0H5R6R2_9EUKA|eukprot:CRZ09526.1 hypothetical protein [Spongospora subterranea]
MVHGVWAIIGLISLVNAQVRPAVAPRAEYPKDGLQLAVCVNSVLWRLKSLDYFPSHTSLQGLYSTGKFPPNDGSVDFHFDSRRFKDVIAAFTGSSDCDDAHLLLWNWRTSAFVEGVNAPNQYDLWSSSNPHTFHRFRFIKKGQNALLYPFVNLYGISTQPDSPDLRWTVIANGGAQLTKFASDLPSSLFAPTIKCSFTALPTTRCPPDIRKYLLAMFGSESKLPGRFKNIAFPQTESFMNEWQYYVILVLIQVLIITFVVYYRKRNARQKLG